MHCPKCGQKSNLHRLSMHDVFHEAVHYFTHADKGLFQLLRDLLLKNGVVAREYVLGKRKKYFPPLSFFLLVAAVFVFIFSLQSPEVPIYSEASQRVMSPQSLRELKVRTFFNGYSNFVAMFALPFTAAIYWLFYIKTRYNYTEHLVGGMYLTGFFLLCYAIVILPLAKLIGLSSNVALGILFLFQVFYSSAFYYRFINRTGIGAKFKAVGAASAVMIIWVLLSGSAVRLYINNGVWGLLP
jgi:hypothetical protein